MIEFIRGELAELTPTVAVVESFGIGYEVNITLLDYDKLKENKKEEKVRLYIHESIREDAHVLFGFINKESRELFRLLISVSGVGPNTARLILSSLTVEQLENSISTGNAIPLKTVKGIGGKTAQRILVDLKDKIKGVGNSLILSTPVAGETFNDSVSALVMLGFSTVQSQKVLTKIFSENPALSAEQAIKLALKML